MKLDILGLQAFIAIADHGGFGRAAERLHLTQTALTRRLQNLEDSLGVRLVERTTRSTALSELGRAFLPRARRLVDDLGAALNEIRETGKALRGDVTIACVPTVGVHYLPRIIQRYSARHPENRVRILDHASVNVAEAVLRREKPDFFQINYSLADRESEKRLIPLAADVGAAVLTNLPFGRGRLFRATRGRKLPDWAAEFDAGSWAQLFLKYLLGNPAVTAVIPGTDKPQYMVDNLNAGRGRMPDAAQRNRIVELYESFA